VGGGGLGDGTGELLHLVVRQPHPRIVTHHRGRGNLTTSCLIEIGTNRDSREAPRGSPSG
jgi:hypothetical protein